MASTTRSDVVVGGTSAEQSFRGDAPRAWRQLFAWLSAREGIRDDRARSVRGIDFEPADSTGDGSIPIAVRLPLRRAGRDVSALCAIDPAAVRHLSGFLDLKLPVVFAVAQRSPRALAYLIGDAWEERVGVALLRWRVVDTTVRAILSAEYVPVNDVALARVMEAPLVALGLAPCRGLRSDTETRIEFATAVSANRQSGAHRPGLVLRNSETGHASVTLSPALVRHNGVATRLAEPSVEQRHVIADRDALAQRLVSAVPALLNAARVACQRWSSVRQTPCAPAQLQRASGALEKALGKTLESEIFAGFERRTMSERTPSALFAETAAAIRSLPAHKRSEADTLLSALLNDTVMQSSHSPRRSAL